MKEVSFQVENPFNQTELLDLRASKGLVCDLKTVKEQIQNQRLVNSFAQVAMAMVRYPRQIASDNDVYDVKTVITSKVKKGKGFEKPKLPSVLV